MLTECFTIRLKKRNSTLTDKQVKQEWGKVRTSISSKIKEIKSSSRT